MASLRSAAARLGQLHIPTRDPNGQPGGVPAEVFSADQASEAIAHATEVMERAEHLMK
jgi:HEPN domain-containing protein